MISARSVRSDAMFSFRFETSEDALRRVGSSKRCDAAPV